LDYWKGCGVKSVDSCRHRNKLLRRFIPFVFTVKTNNHPTTQHVVPIVTAACSGCIISRHRAAQKKLKSFHITTKRDRDRKL